MTEPTHIVDVSDFILVYTNTQTLCGKHVHNEPWIRRIDMYNTDPEDLCVECYDREALMDLADTDLEGDSDRRDDGDLLTIRSGDGTGAGLTGGTLILHSGPGTVSNKLQISEDGDIE